MNFNDIQQRRENVSCPLDIGQFQKIEQKYFDKYIEELDPDALSDEALEAFHKNYENMEDFMPTRSTAGSAGYDFKALYTVTIEPHSEVLIPTAIKAWIDPNWMLCMFPRSGLGCKYSVRLANTVGIIDSDYFSNEGNDGHIMIKLRNPSDKTIVINEGDRFCQGIFMMYGTVIDDNPRDMKRSGGMGSTGK